MTPPSKSLTELSAELLINEIKKLLNSIADDNYYGGGLLSRETIRISNEVRITLYQLEATQYVKRPNRPQ